LGGGKNLQEEEEYRQKKENEGRKNMQMKRNAE